MVQDNDKLNNLKNVAFKRLIKEKTLVFKLTNKDQCDEWVSKIEEIVREA
jgi:hypothetical protein